MARVIDELPPVARVVDELPPALAGGVQGQTKIGFSQTVRLKPMMVSYPCPLAKASGNSKNLILHSTSGNSSWLTTTIMLTVSAVALEFAASIQA